MKSRKRVIFWAAAAVICLLLVVWLTGLSGESNRNRRIDGLVTGLVAGEDGELTALVIRTRQGDETAVLLTDETLAYPAEDGSWTREELRAAFTAAVRPDVLIEAECARRKTSLTTDGGARLPAYEAERVYITGWLERGAVTMRDGTPVDVLTRDPGPRAGRIYLLADGTELLWVNAPYGPERSYTEGVESFDTLNEAAQRAVSGYYEQSGLLYDEQEQLEKVYALYQQLGEGFSSGMVSQGVTASAASERVIWFRTTLQLPAGHENGNIMAEFQLCDAFDRETGAHIDTWDLFTAPKETVIGTILEESSLTDPDLLAGLKAADWTGRITFYSDSLQVWFGPDDLPGEENAVGLCVDYTPAILELLQPWAVGSFQGALPGSPRGLRPAVLEGFAPWAPTGGLAPRPLPAF